MDVSHDDNNNDNDCIELCLSIRSANLHGKN